MRFLMMVKSDVKAEAGVLPDERMLSEMGKYNEGMTKAGVMLAGEGLQASSKGARIRISSAKSTVMDGPFTEAKELVAGYSIIQVESKEEAIEWARRCLQIHVDGSGIEEGEIEVRQVFELPDFPVDSAEKPDGWRQQEQLFRERAE